MKFTFTSCGHWLAHTHAELELALGREYAGDLRGAAYIQMAVRVMKRLQSESDLAPLRSVVLLRPLLPRGRLHL